MDDQDTLPRPPMLIIGAHDGKLRLACDACGAHAIRSSSLLFWSARCEVCGEIAEIHGPRERISQTRGRNGHDGTQPVYGSYR